MNQPGPMIRWQWLLATLLVVAVMLVFGACRAQTTSEAAAAAANCSYYNNANHSTLVGQFGRDCCNNTVAWGTKTSFSECSSVCLLCVPPAP